VWWIIIGFPFLDMKKSRHRGIAGRAVELVVRGSAGGLRAFSPWCRGDLGHCRVVMAASTMEVNVNAGGLVDGLLAERG